MSSLASTSILAEEPLPNDENPPNETGLEGIRIDAPSNNFAEHDDDGNTTFHPLSEAEGILTPEDSSLRRDASRRESPEIVELERTTSKKSAGDAEHDGPPNDSRTNGDRAKSRCRARSRDQRQCQKHFREMIGRHEIRNDELEQREADLRQRLDTLECSMPAVMVWNTWRMAQGAPISGLHNVVAKQFQPPVSSFPACPTSPSQHWDCRVREVEAARKQAQSRAEEARQVFAVKESALQRQKDQIEEARKIQEERKEKVTKLQEEVTRLREALEKARGDENFCGEGECGEIRCRQMWLKDVASANSIHSTDLECLARLQDLAEAELCMKRRIADLERKECAYMRTLQQADEMWGQMEEENATSTKELREQLEGKMSANQKLADRIVELEDDLERSRRQLTSSQNELADRTEKLASFTEKTFLEKGLGERELGATFEKMGQTDGIVPIDAEAQVEQVEEDEEEFEGRGAKEKIEIVEMIDARVGGDEVGPSRVEVEVIDESEGVMIAEVKDRGTGADEPTILVDSITSTEVFEETPRTVGRLKTPGEAIAREAGVQSEPGFGLEVAAQATIDAREKETETSTSTVDRAVGEGESISVMVDWRESTEYVPVNENDVTKEETSSRNEKHDDEIIIPRAESTRIFPVDDRRDHGKGIVETLMPNREFPPTNDNITVSIEHVISWYKVAARFDQLIRSCSTCAQKVTDGETMMRQMRDYLGESIPILETNEDLKCECKETAETKDSTGRTKTSVFAKSGPCICQPNTCPLDSPSPLRDPIPTQPSVPPSSTGPPSPRSNVHSQTVTDTQSQTSPRSRIPAKENKNSRLNKPSTRLVDDSRLTVIAEGNESVETVRISDATIAKRDQKTRAKDESTVTVDDTGSQTEAAGSRKIETVVKNFLSKDEKTACICPSGVCPKTRLEAGPGEFTSRRTTITERNSRGAEYSGIAEAILVPSIKKLPSNGPRKRVNEEAESIGSSSTLACCECGKPVTPVTSRTKRSISRSSSDFGSDDFVCCTCKSKSRKVKGTLVAKGSSKSKDGGTSKSPKTSCSLDACCPCENPTREDTTAKGTDCSCETKSRPRPETKDQSCLAKIPREKGSKGHSSRKKDKDSGTSSILSGSSDASGPKVCCSSIERALIVLKETVDGGERISEGRDNKKETSKECICDD